MLMGGRSIIEPGTWRISCVDLIQRRQRYKSNFEFANWSFVGLALDLVWIN